MLKLSGIIIAVVLVFIASPARTPACPLELPIASISINGHVLTVELAGTPDARTCGLSRRDELPPDHGMLFIFPDFRPQAFWMKDTRIPLSIAFLDDDGKIMSIQDMAPMRTDVEYNSPGPTRYALEVNQGWFKRHAIEVGDPVAMALPLAIVIK
jgi:uncharacterized protein